MNNFNHTGFNRNAFGNNHGWNSWGGHFWGAGWNQWGGGWGCWAGPVFWPFLLGDIFSFAFWPYAYYDPFWAFGPAFILVSIFTPGPYFGLDYGYAPDYFDYFYGPDYYADEMFPYIYYGTYGGGAGSRSGGQHVAKATPADREALAQTHAEAVQSCGGLAPGVTGLPIDQIRQTVQPTGDQQTALDNLSAASSQANEIVKASCPAELPLTPIGRLDAAEKRLQATIQAAQMLRSPLQSFYDALTDEQRQKFDAMGNASSRAEGVPSGGNLAALCSQQNGQQVQIPVRRIEQVVQPNAQQRDAFDALKTASENSANQLQSSCPTQMPQTPVARLDAVQTRLNAMVDAMQSVRPKLENFYASLNDEQKARFNTMGPPASTQARQQRNSP